MLQSKVNDAQIVIKKKPLFMQKCFNFFKFFILNFIEYNRKESFKLNTFVELIIQLAMMDAG